jgi:hypothetical protein
MVVKSESACPMCRSQRVAPSRFQGILESIIWKFLDIHPFRCDTCNSRFYLFSTVNVSGQQSESN